MTEREKKRDARTRTQHEKNPDLDECFVLRRAKRDTKGQQLRERGTADQLLSDGIDGK